MSFSKIVQIVRVSPGNAGLLRGDKRRPHWNVAAEQAASKPRASGHGLCGEVRQSTAHAGQTGRHHPPARPPSCQIRSSSRIYLGKCNVAAVLFYGRLSNSGTRHWLHYRESTKTWLRLNYMNQQRLIIRPKFTYRICRNKRPPKTMVFQRGGAHKTDGFWWVIFQRGEYTKPDGFWWVIFQRGSTQNPMGFDGWFLKEGSTQNRRLSMGDFSKRGGGVHKTRWVLMGDFSKGGVHKTDGFLIGFGISFIALKN